jgi:hypothetical protein
MKREYPTMLIDPKKFFNFRVRRNLHICLALTCNGDSFRLILKNYPTLISNIHMHWIYDWHEEYLIREAKFFMRDRLSTQQLRDSLSKCMSDIHMFMLNECKQINWAGPADKEVKMQVSSALAGNPATASHGGTSTTPHTKQSNDRSKKDLAKLSKESQEQQLVQPTTTVINVPNLPYSKTMLHELIR